MKIDEETQKKSNPEKINSGVISDEIKIETLPTSSPSFSKLLQGVVMAASVSNSTFSPVGLQQGQFGVSHQEPPVTVGAEAAQAHCQMKAQDNSSTTPLSIKQDKSCIPTSSTISQVNIQSRDKSHVQVGTETSLTQDLVIRPDSTAQFSLATLPSPLEEVDKRSSDVLVDDVPRTPKSDGYCWRKYGQKQVKSVGSLRSYYRCTNTSCSARKKVQHVDLSGEIIDVVYKGEHNHEPPPKGFSRKRFSSESSARKLDGPCRPSSTSRESEQVVRINFECHDSNLNTAVGTSLRDVEEQHPKIPDGPDAMRLESEPSKVPAEVEHGSSSNSNEHSKIDTMNERDIPIKKRRIKEESKACSEPVYRTFKEPKVVVHEAADAGTSTDGYRWRKYGQKMVKGNPHPRSYYRCSTAGCPVRKHVEKASDGSSAILAMYEGEHNHEMPAPKTQPSAPKSLVPPTDAVNNVPLLMLEDRLQSPDPVNYVPLLMLEDKPQSPAPVSPPQQSRDSHTDIGEEKATSDVGADKVTESQSARTLLTIGIELESC